ncbi:MAG TPA: COQ9 family protein [Alphaproteobacteria bacterium]|nr:COQ9 family protein [Alphaproteobacteria bacterium]
MSEDGPELEAAREAILIAALRHVPFDRWTDKAIQAGIRDAGYRESLSTLAFPGGPKELAEAYCAFADARMEAALDADVLAAMSVRERIAYAVNLRMTQAENERAAVAELMAFFALPGNQPLAAKCMYRTVDSIWRAIGDTSTDFNFYSKRAILASVIGATVLYWLGDESEHSTDTRAFLDRRIEDVMAFEKAKGKAQEIFGKLPDPFRILRDVTRPRGKPGHEGDGGGEGTPGAANGGSGEVPDAGSNSDRPSGH